MPKHPLISIPLDIPAVRVRQTERTKAGELILTVESTLSSTNCRRYGRTITERHGVDVPRLLRHLPILGRIVYLRIRPKRCRCPWCDDHPTTTQQLDWYDPNALHTKVYERHLIVQMVNSTLTDGEAKEDVTAAALLGILDRGIAKSVEWDALAPFTTVGIDEIALLKGQRDFVAVISAVSEDGELHVLAVLPDRLKATLLTWLLTIPAAIRSRITTVCTDVNQWCINTLSDQWEPKIIGISHLDREIYKRWADAVQSEEENVLWGIQLYDKWYAEVCLRGLWVVLTTDWFTYTSGIWSLLQELASDVDEELGAAIGSQPRLITQAILDRVYARFKQG